MAIYYVCKDCHGRGKVEKKVLFKLKKVTCDRCQGTGKIRKISNPDDQSVVKS